MRQLFQFARGGCAAKVVKGCIFLQGNNSVLVNPVGGTFDALFWRVFFLVQTTHASHVALQNRFAFKMFDKLGRRQAFFEYSMTAIYQQKGRSKDTQAHIVLLWLATNRLKILDNVFDTVMKCLLPPFKSGGQSKLHHACLSKKNSSFY